MGWETTPRKLPLRGRCGDVARVAGVLPALRRGLSGASADALSLLYGLRAHSCFRAPLLPSPLSPGHTLPSHRCASFGRGCVGAALTEQYIAMSVDSSFVGGGATGRVVGSPAGRLTVLPFFFVDTTITDQRGRGHTRVMNQLSVVCHRTGIVLLFFFPPDARAGGDGSTRRQHATPAWKN